MMSLPTKPQPGMMADKVVMVYRGKRKDQSGVELYVEQLGNEYPVFLNIFDDEEGMDGTIYMTKSDLLILGHKMIELARMLK